MADPHGDAGVVEHLARRRGRARRRRRRRPRPRGRAASAGPTTRTHGRSRQTRRAAAAVSACSWACDRGPCPSAVEVVDGRGQADGLGGDRHAGLEPLRRRRRRSCPPWDDLDHRAAGEERRHRVEQLAAAPEHADAGRPEHLVAGEGGEVDAERRRRRPAGAARDWQASSTVERADRVGRARRARATGLTVPSTLDDVGEREHLGALGEQAVEVGEVEPAVVGDRHPAQASRRCAGTAPATARGWRGAPSR